MDTSKIAERIAAPYIKAAGKLPEALEDNKFTKNDPDNPNPKGNDRDGDGKTNEKKPDWVGKEAGCEKLPEGGMRDNCEKKSEGKEDKKEATDRIAASMGSANEQYLDSLSSMDKDNILKAVANHYNTSVREMEGEVTDRGAEALYEYLSFNNSMAMKVYRDFKSMRLAGCEKLPAGGMRDNCEKKSKGGDSKSDDKDDKKPDFLKEKD